LIFFGNARPSQFAVNSPTQSTPTATSNDGNHNELIEQGLSPARFLDSKTPTA
jgi:hypothetical protein